MTIIISPQAEKRLRKIPKFEQIVIARKTRSIGAQSVPDEEKLSGYKNIFRVRVGDYRIVYRRFPESVYVIMIGHRKEVYDLLTRLIR